MCVRGRGRVCSCARIACVPCAVFVYVFVFVASKSCGSSGCVPVCLERSDESTRCSVIVGVSHFNCMCHCMFEKVRSCSHEPEGGRTCFACFRPSFHLPN